MLAERGTADIRAYDLTHLAGISVLAEQSALDTDHILRLKVIVLRQIESLPRAGVSDRHSSELYSLFLSPQQKPVSPDFFPPSDRHFFLLFFF